MTKTTGKRTTLLLIDCQKSFHGGGSLAIPNADADAKRIASILNHPDATHAFTDIVATMATHPTLHIAHPGFWVKGEDMKTRPSPFTVINSRDIKEGVWCPRPDMADLSRCVNPDLFTGGREGQECGDRKFDLTNYCVEYTRKLESSGKFQFRIWPEHCVIGTDGTNIVDGISEALTSWEYSTGNTVHYVMKGQNSLTDMYSVFQAEVPVSPDTSFNQKLYDRLRSSDFVVVAGEASSHCVNFSVRDLVTRWPEEELDKIILLKDCASAAPGFEGSAQCFYKDMEDVGVTQCCASDLLQLLMAAS